MKTLKKYFSTCLIGDVCPEGWTQTSHGEKCYTFAGRTRNFADAQSTCESLEALIAEPRDKESLMAIKDILEENDAVDGMQENNVEKLLGI